MGVEPDDVKYRFSIYNISLFNVLQIPSIYFINLNIHHVILLSSGVFATSKRCKMIYEGVWSRGRNI
jgi:hypothetical protein